MPRPLGGVESSKQKQGVWLGLGFGRGGSTRRGQGRRDRGCAPGRWARGERNEAGAVRPWRGWHWVGNGSDAGPGAPLRRRVLGDWPGRPRRTWFPPDRDTTAGWRRVSGTVSGPTGLSLFVAAAGAGCIGVPSPQPREGPGSCPQLQLRDSVHRIWGDAGGMDGESRRLSTILGVPFPHFVTGVRWGGAS